MGHFAKLSKDNVVEQVIVVNNEVFTVDGKEDEQVGIDFCKSLFGADTNWIQTSYNGSFRGRYAGAGMKYDPVKDEFVVEE